MTQRLLTRAARRVDDFGRRPVCVWIVAMAQLHARRAPVRNRDPLAERSVLDSSSGQPLALPLAAVIRARSPGQ